MNASRHMGVVAMCVIGGGIMFSVPYFVKSNTKSLDRKDGKLTGTQRQRGMYMNAGSQDAGVDPDWDPVQRKWMGHERRKRQAETEKSDT